MILSCSWTGKGKDPFGNSPGFQDQMDDLRLKGRILFIAHEITHVKKGKGNCAAGVHPLWLEGRGIGKLGRTDGKAIWRGKALF